MHTAVGTSARSRRTACGVQHMTQNGYITDHITDHLKADTARSPRFVTLALR